MTTPEESAFGSAFQSKLEPAALRPSAPFFDTAWRVSTQHPIAEVHYIETIVNDAPTPELYPYPTIELKPSSMVVKMEMFRTNARVPTDHKLMMKRYGIDAITTLSAQLKDKSDGALARELVSAYEELASEVPIPRTRWQRLVASLGVSMPVYVDSGRAAAVHIMRMSSAVASAGRRGRADFAVASPNYVSMLTECQGFVYSAQHAPGAESARVPALVGSVVGIAVYVDPKMRDGRVVVGRTTGESDPGVLLAEGDPSLEIVDLPPLAETMLTFHVRRAVVRMRGAEAFYRRMDAVIGSKPRWRRWLFL